MEVAEKKNSKTGFYFVITLLALCLLAYAGTPFFVKKAPQMVDITAPGP